MKSKTIILKSRPKGLPQLSDFALEEIDVPMPADGQILLKSLYISVDPYLRGRMSGTKSPRFELGQPVASRIVAEVIASKHPDFREGEFVNHYLDWKEYQVSDGAGLVKVDPAAAPLTAHLGILGTTGLSGYFPLLDFGQPKAGETLVVSGAAGAVGSIAGQIGKLMGCRVVGIAGTDEKTALLRNKFGFDEAINYRKPGLADAIAQIPGGASPTFSMATRGETHL